MIRKSKSEIIKKLKKSGFRMTRHRQAIINFIAERHDHPSVRHIHEKIRLKDPLISLATVYNTLNMLVKMKLLKEIDFENTDNRYDTNLAPHINLICIICGSINDYKYDLPVDPDIIRAKEGFIVKESKMEYRGICSNCHKKNSPTG